MGSFAVFPKSLIIEPTINCNRKCPFCPRTNYDARKHGFMEMGLFTRLMDEINEHRGRTVHLFRRGESLLHPKIIDMFEYARPRVDDLQLTTNATLLSRKYADALVRLVDFISFSIDIPSKFSVNRDGDDYERTVENIEYFLSKAQGVRTQVSMVLTDHTEAEIQQFHDRWKSSVERVRVYSQHSADGHYGSLPYDRGARRTCMKPFSEILIYYNGLTGRCNHDWNGKPLGDVSGRSIREVWEGKAYEDLRVQHKTLQITDETCKHCDSWYPNMVEQGTGYLFEGAAEQKTPVVKDTAL
ncbi:MAG: radical SAM protein [Myxococcaceae bacterium]|nr:radical SAM protein [Myxococcaceae bacterium]